MKILVTGGAGFIGSHLCESLLTDGHDVFCMDNLLTGDQRNLEGFADNPRFEFILADVSHPFNLEVDCIVHMASPASPVDYSRMPVETMLANSQGTYNALELTRKVRCRFLLASTSEVYGDPLVSPQPESYLGNVNPVGPRACYDEAKRFAEALTSTYTRMYGVDAVILRIFNTFGPRMRREDGRVVPNFISQALEGRPLTIYGDGSQTRSFCYVADLVEGIKTAIRNPGLAGEIINLGNDAEMTILEFARVVKEMMGVDSDFTYQPLPQDDPLQRRPDLAKARRLLGWEPRFSLEEGLRLLIAWFKEQSGQGR
jgi:nucleoside-diphosphate-sugar epimerase